MTDRLTPALLTMDADKWAFVLNELKNGFSSTTDAKWLLAEVEAQALAVQRLTAELDDKQRAVFHHQLRAEQAEDRWQAIREWISDRKLIPQTTYAAVLAQMAALDPTPTREDRCVARDNRAITLPCCLDCQLPYTDFPLDVILPRAQWLEIYPHEGGLLCAMCIVKRAAKVPGCTCVHAILEIVPTREEPSR